MRRKSKGKGNLCYFLFLRWTLWHKLNHTTWQITPAEIAAKCLKIFWEEVRCSLLQTPSLWWTWASQVKDWWLLHFCPFPCTVLFWIPFPLQDKSRPQFLCPAKQTLQSNHDTLIYNLKRQDQVHNIKKYLFRVFQYYKYFIYNIFDCRNKEWPW